MKMFSLHTVKDERTFGISFFMFYIISLSLVINTLPKRTDVFLSAGVLPFSFTVAFGMSDLNLAKE